MLSNGNNEQLSVYSHEGLFIKQISRDSFVMEAHFHPYYEICYLSEGERHYFVRDRTYHMVKGDLILIPGNELHRAMDAKHAKYEKLEIDFLPSFLSPLNKLLNCKQLLAPFEHEELLLRLGPQEQEKFTNFYFDLKHELRQRGFAYTAQLKMLISQLLIFIERIQPDMPRIHEAPSVYYHAKSRDLIQYVNENFKDKLNLEMLAERYDYHPGYISILFKKITGFTFVEYINNMRVKASQDLLQNTELPITDICVECGFNSLSHFGRVFKQITGIAPSEYRKR